MTHVSFILSQSTQFVASVSTSRDTLHCTVRNSVSEGQTLIAVKLRGLLYAWSTRHKLLTYKACCCRPSAWPADWGLCQIAAMNCGSWCWNSFMWRLHCCCRPSAQCKTWQAAHAASYSASQQTSHILNTRRFITVFTDPPLALVLSHRTPAHSLPSCVFEIHLILSYNVNTGLPKRLLTLYFPIKVCKHFWSLPMRATWHVGTVE